VLSRELKCRPSQLLGLTEVYEAFCIDEAVVLWGMHVRNEVQEVGEKKSSKQKAKEGQKATRLRSMLEATKDGARKFATPFATR
jgi:hypothetical protein